jgi:AcrR family transcriptional regulator
MAKNIKSIERREREREAMREQILNVAMALLIKEGYEAVTIRRLADEIAYTPGALYSYFKDKDEIVFALVQRASQHLNAVFRAVESMPNPLERLWAIGRAYIKFAMEHQEYYDLLFIMSTPIQRMIEAGFTEGHTTAFFILRTTVHECIQHGYLPEADADVAAFAMWSFVHGGVSLVIRKRTTMIPEEKMQGLLDGAYSFVMSSMMPRHHQQTSPILPSLKKSR